VYTTRVYLSYTHQGMPPYTHQGMPPYTPRDIKDSSKALQRLFYTSGLKVLKGGSAPWGRESSTFINFERFNRGFSGVSHQLFPLFPVIS